jgi:hypothetical protein
MKRIEHLLILIVLSGFVLVSFQYCSQYPDNNGITLLSKVDRISKTWKVENYKINSTDFTSLVSGYTETFTNSGTYSFQWAIIGGTGTWVFQNKDAEVQITDVSNVSSRTLFILKLEEKALWYYYMDGNDKKEFHMVPK